MRGPRWPAGWRAESETRGELFSFERAHAHSTHSCDAPLSFSVLSLNLCVALWRCSLQVQLHVGGGTCRALGSLPLWRVGCPEKHPLFIIYFYATTRPNESHISGTPLAGPCRHIAYLRVHSCHKQAVWRDEPRANDTREAGSKAVGDRMRAPEPSHHASQHPTSTAGQSPAPTGRLPGAHASQVRLGVDKLGRGRPPPCGSARKALIVARAHAPQ